MTGKLIASRIAIRRRYVRSVDLARDVDDPNALEGYVITPSVRDAAVRILAGLSVESRQRAFVSLARMVQGNPRSVCSLRNF